MSDVENKLVEILGRDQLTRTQLFQRGSDHFTKKEMEAALKNLVKNGKVLFIDRKYYEAAK
jgi:hypothetical protein